MKITNKKRTDIRVHHHSGVRSLIVTQLSNTKPITCIVPIPFVIVPWNGSQLPYPQPHHLF